MTSPCKKNGKDCPKRRVGCRGTCAAWTAYQIVLVGVRERRKEAMDKGQKSKRVKTRRYVPANEGSRVKNERKK